MAKLKAYVLNDGEGGEILSVACDNPQADRFQQCKNAAMEVLGHHYIDTEYSKDIGHMDGRGVNDWYKPGLLVALRDAHERYKIFQYDEKRWQQFQMMTVTSGPLQDLRILGIGTTKKTRERACHAAVVLAAIRQRQQSLGESPPTLHAFIRGFAIVESVTDVGDSPHVEVLEPAGRQEILENGSAKHDAMQGCVQSSDAGTIHVGITEGFQTIASNPEALAKFASSLGKKPLKMQERGVGHFLEKLEPLVKAVWGEQAYLTKHGSRAKGTFLDESDFDYHIDNTRAPVTRKEMHEFRAKCKLIKGVHPIWTIKLALVLACKFTDHQKVMSGGIQKQQVTFNIDIVPSFCDYVEESDIVENLSMKPTTYFLKRVVAGDVVKLLKYFFQHTGPCLKGCELERLVEYVDKNASNCKLHGAMYLTYLFLYTLQILLEGHSSTPGQYRAMCDQIHQVYPAGPLSVSRDLGSLASETSEFSNGIRSFFERWKHDVYWSTDAQYSWGSVRSNEDAADVYSDVEEPLAITVAEDGEEA